MENTYNLLPPLTTAEFETLRADINAHGVREPVIVDEDGNVLDGNHRLRIDPKAPRRVLKGLSDGEKKAFVFRANFCRRNLSPEQKREAHKRMRDVAEKLRTEDARKWTQRRVAEALGVARETVRNWFGDSGNDGQQAKASAPDARVKIPSSEDATIADRVEAGESQEQVAADYGVSDRTIRQHLSAEKARRKKKKKQRENARKVATVKDPLAEGVTFSAIMIDPPWSPVTAGVNDVFERNPDYATMSIEEIAALPVSKLSAEDSHLYLWVVNRTMRHGFELLEGWGFRFVTIITWCKPSIGVGNYFRNNTEHILFGVKGKLGLCRKNEGTWFTAKRGGRKHSAKPKEAFELVERCSPGPYLEMFSRQQRKGWVCWGESAQA